MLHYPAELQCTIPFVIQLSCYRIYSHRQRQIKWNQLELID